MGPFELPTEERLLSNLPAGPDGDKIVAFIKEGRNFFMDLQIAGTGDDPLKYSGAGLNRGLRIWNRRNHRRYIFRVDTYAGDVIAMG